MHMFMFNGGQHGFQLFEGIRGGNVAIEYKYRWTQVGDVRYEFLDGFQYSLCVWTDPFALRVTDGACRIDMCGD